MHSATPRLVVDLKVIRENYNLIKKICSQSEVAISAKADCYGLGAKDICLALADEGARQFFVFNCYEGKALRLALQNLDITISILSGPHLEDAQEMVDYNLVPVINHLEQAKLWQQIANKNNKKLPAILYFDTSLNRYALTKDEYDYIADNKHEFKNIEVKQVMSHFSSAEEPNSAVTKRQAKLFDEEAVKFPDAQKCLANSGGIVASKDFHFDMVRSGAMIYGLNPYFDHVKLARTPEEVAFFEATKRIKNPVKLEAPILQIFDLQAGEAVGYNCTYIADKKCKIATVAIGYADGIRVSSSNVGYGFIAGRAVPIAGRVSMDLVSLDVTEIPQQDLALGNMVEFIGPSISADEVAQSIGTIGYEVLTNIGNRVKKLYTNK